MATSRINGSRVRSSLVLAAAAATVAALGLAGAPAASAVLPCPLLTFYASGTCTLGPGETVPFTIKAGNGGVGGRGNAGAGGNGGIGGAGAQVTGVYTNTSGSTETLTLTVGTDGIDGATGAPSFPGANGGSGTVSEISVGASTLVRVTGGLGGDGGDAAAGSTGDDGSDGSRTVPASLPAGWTDDAFNFSTPFISFVPPTPPAPEPVPVYPPGAPIDVTATPASASATVHWSAPTYIGSFPITNYQVTSSPGNKVCLAAAPALSCDVTGLTNGTAYTFTVRALNGAGWGAPSEASNMITPERKSIVITGSREGSIIKVTGRTAGLVGAEVTPWVKLSGDSSHQAGTGLRTVTADGTFAWSRKTGKSGEVNFESGDVRSNVVVFRAR